MNWNKNIKAIEKRQNETFQLTISNEETRALKKHRSEEKEIDAIVMDDCDALEETRENKGLEPENKFEFESFVGRNFQYILEFKNSNGANFEIFSNSEKIYKIRAITNKDKHATSKDEHAPLLSAIQYRSDSFDLNLTNGLKDNSFNLNKDNIETIEQRQLGTFQPTTSNEEIGTLKKRELEELETVVPSMDDCNKLETIRLKKRLELETKFGAGSPYTEYILKYELSNTGLEKFVEFHTKKCVSCNEAKIDDKMTSPSSCKDPVRKIKSGPAKQQKVTRTATSIRNKNCIDVLGNHLTSKDRYKLRVNCPNCSKTVPAPSSVRHLSYCMKVGIRKRTKPA